MKTRISIRRLAALGACLAAGIAALAPVPMSEAAEQPAEPVLGNKGPSGQRFVVRIDGVSIPIAQIHGAP